MIISHTNTATIGDFANTWPLLSYLSKVYGPLELSLPSIYENFIGLKDLLEYQDFISSVDFLDRKSDIDVQAHCGYISSSIPKRCYYSADIIGCSIDRDLVLKCPDIPVDPSICEKTIIIDRLKTNIFKQSGWFTSENYYWLDWDLNRSDRLLYNINICLKAKKVIATFTGLPIILDLFNKKFDLIYFDDLDGIRAYQEHYFPERNSRLFYYKNYDINNTTI
jgi:hypothetical protein